MLPAYRYIIVMMMMIVCEVNVLDFMKRQLIDHSDRTVVSFVSRSLYRHCGERKK